MTPYLCDHCHKAPATVHDPSGGCHLCKACDEALTWAEMRKAG